MFSCSLNEIVVDYVRQTHLWLHTGNIMIDGRLCKLSGFEVELLRAKTESCETSNDARAGLVAVGMSYFPVL